MITSDAVSGEFWPAFLIFARVGGGMLSRVRNQRRSRADSPESKYFEPGQGHLGRV